MITSAMDRTLRLAFLLKPGMCTEGMLLNWLTLDLVEMLVIELDMIDWQDETAIDGSLILQKLFRGQDNSVNLTKLF